VVEQVSQGEEANLAAATGIQGDREDERVEEGDVVGGQQDPAAGRDALGPTTRRSASSHTSSRASGARRS
jgi:hypothetical protein